LPSFTLKDTELIPGVSPVVQAVVSYRRVPRILGLFYAAMVSGPGCVPHFGGFGRHSSVGPKKFTAERIETEEQRWLQFCKACKPCLNYTGAPPVRRRHLGHCRFR
jgi:hypothetical protein